MAQTTTLGIHQCGPGCFGHPIPVAADDEFINGNQIRNEPLMMDGDVRFKLFRGNDESGVSGTGLVLTGVIFADGTTVVRWCADEADRSTVIYGSEGYKDGWHRFLDIHVQSHPTNDVTIRLEDEGGRRVTWQQRSDPAAVRDAYVERLVTQLGKWDDNVGAYYPEFMSNHVRNLAERIDDVRVSIARMKGEL